MTAVNGPNRGRAGGPRRREPGGTEKASILRTVSRWMPKRRAASRVWLQSNRRRRNDMSDDQPVLLDDDPIDDEPENPLLGLERRVDERVPDAVAERLQPL